MKGKVVTWRPTVEMRERLDRLAEATGHSLSYHIEKAIEAHMPELEARYARELRELAAKKAAEGKRKPNSLKDSGRKLAQDIVKKALVAPPEAEQ